MSVKQDEVKKDVNVKPEDVKQDNTDNTVKPEDDLKSLLSSLTEELKTVKADLESIKKSKADNTVKEDNTVKPDENKQSFTKEDVLELLKEHDKVKERKNILEGLSDDEKTHFKSLKVNIEEIDVNTVKLLLQSFRSLSKEEKVNRPNSPKIDPKIDPKTSDNIKQLRNLFKIEVK